jgi:hypothetical protein
LEEASVLLNLVFKVVISKEDGGQHRLYELVKKERANAEVKVILLEAQRFEV